MDIHKLEQQNKVRYYSIRNKAIRLGLHDKVESYAKELQKNLSEGSYRVPLWDAYEMAYHEIVIPKYY